MFVLQNLPTDRTRIAGIETTPFATGTQSAKFDLTLVASEVSEGLRTAVIYNTDLFDAATIERMLRHFEVCWKVSSKTRRRAFPDTASHRGRTAQVAD